MASPLEQFTIRRYNDLSVGGVDAAFTNASLFMLVILGVVGAFLFLGSRSPQLVPGRWQAALEAVTDFVNQMVDENIGPGGKRYVPFIFAIFMFVLSANLLGLLPYTFTVTSHLAVTFGLAALIFVLCIVIGLLKHGFRFFKIFVPSGAPWPLLFLIIPVEILSYLARPLTLSVRLFANMTAGHILLEVFIGFVVSLGLAGVFLAPTAILPFALTVTFYALELIVAVVQAYIFALLTSMYLNDSINLSH